MTERIALINDLLNFNIIIEWIACYCSYQSIKSARRFAKFPIIWEFETLKLECCQFKL